jgi:hypothetical protein
VELFDDRLNIRGRFLPRPKKRATGIGAVRGISPTDESGLRRWMATAPERIVTAIPTVLQAGPVVSLNGFAACVEALARTMT